MKGDITYLDDYKPKTFFEKVKSKFSYYKTSLFHFKYDLIEGCKSLWRWRKIIWNDRTWGYDQILKILIFKLKIDSDAFLKNNRTTATTKMVAEMQEVIRLLERYKEDDYLKLEKIEHDAKWGEDKTYFVELESGDYEWKSERDGLLSPEDLKQEQEEFRERMLRAQEAKEADLKNALKIIRKKLEGWWD